MNSNIEHNTEFIQSYFSDLESNPFLPVFWIDGTGRILNVNDAVCAILGYDRKELTGMNISQLDPSVSIEKVKELVDYIRQYKVNRFEARHRRKDGVILDVEVISNYYKVDGFEFSCNYVFDISDKKQQERELLKSNAKLAETKARQESLISAKTKELKDKIAKLEDSEKIAKSNEELFINAFKTSQDAINLNDIDNGTYIYVNKGFLDIMGYTPEEVIGKSSLDLDVWKVPEDRLKMVEIVKKNGFCHNFEADFLRKDGSLLHGLMSASIQEYKGTKVLLNVSKDITEIKRLENALKELNSQLQERVKKEVATIRKQQEIIFEQKKLADMGMMINAIAHQWRQPLNIIGLRTQELAENYRDGELTNDFVKEFEEKQMSTVEYLSTTIEDFRTFFKPDDKESKFDVSVEIIALLKLIEIQMLAKGIKASISFHSPSENIENSSIGEFPVNRPH